jgi:hypothetical protein
MKRYLVGFAAVGVAFASSFALAAPALAAPPMGGCPPGFILTPVSQLPPAVAGAKSTDVNRDQYTCVKPIATGTPGAGGVVVDNASKVR